MLKKLLGVVGTIYKASAQYLVPVLFAMLLGMSFQAPQVIQVPKPEVITTTVTLPAVTDTMFVTITDTLHTTTTNTIYDTTTIYLPGEIVRVAVSSADTVFVFLSSNKGVGIEAEVEVGVKYYHDPLNEFRLSSSLSNIQLFLPDRMTRTTYWGAGAYFSGNGVGVSASRMKNSNLIVVGYGTNGPLVQYQHIFGK